MNSKCTVKKPHTSCIDTNIIKSVFKGFLHRVHSICFKKYTKEEEKFFIDMFVENGDKKKLLKNLVMEYNNKRNNKSDHENNTQTRLTLDSRHQSKNET